MSDIRYQRSGEYLIPNVTMGKTEKQPLSRYGRMRKKYLQENRPILFNKLLLSGQLQKHLLETERTANRRLEQMMQEMAQQAGLTEEMKAKNQMKWVGQMNALKAQAEEIILEELIYA